MIEGRTLAGLVALASLTLALPACGDDDEEKGSHTPGPSVLFVQNVQGGTFEPIDGQRGAYRVSLTGVDPHSLFFTDRPDRETGVVRQNAMLRGLFRPGQAPPNAALELLGGPASQDVLGVKLGDPKYEPRKRTLTYTARLLNDLTSPNLRHRDDRLDSRPPERFGKAALFIDSIGLGSTCHVNVLNESEYGFGVQSASKWDTDSWDPADPTGKTLLSKGVLWGSVGATGRGCHNEAVLAPKSAGRNSNATVRISLTDPFSGDNSYSCDPARKEVFTCVLDSDKTSLSGNNLDVHYIIRDTPGAPPPG